MKTRVRLFHASLWMASLTLNPSAWGDWVGVEDFESGFAAGETISGTRGWVADSPAKTLATADPAGSGRGRVAFVERGGARNDVYKGLGGAGIANGSTGTLYFEVYFPTANAGTANVNAGLTDMAAPDAHDSFEAQFRWYGEGGESTIFPRSGGTFIDSGFTFDSGEWMSVWMVADAASDTVDMHLMSPTGATSRVQVADGFGFRHGVEPNALISFLIIQSGGQDIYFDNIFVDTSGENLGLPPVAWAEPVAGDDAVEVGIGGAIAFDPFTNDSGSVDPGSLEVISGPAAGTASFAAGAGKLIYKHGGGAAGTDVFRYRITNSGGSLASEAEVAVAISPALRLENVTLEVPLDPPTAAPGSLTAIDALPGLTFPGAVSVASVPGKPEALLIGSVQGYIWLVPDTTAANPTKHLVLNLESLSNMVNSRSIYSIECFPDFASSGNIVVNYQGDKTRLPVPNSSIPNLDRNGVPYTNITCDLRVSRFTLSPAHLAAAMNGLSPAENAAVLATEWPYLNLAEQHTYHTLGDVKFGPDGYLYVSFGDEGEQEANYRNTQTITKDQFSSIIRIDVDPDSTHPKPNPHYAIAVGGLNGAHSPNTPFTNAASQNPNFRIPADNPFVVPGKGGGWDGFFNGIDHGGMLGAVRDEIWAVGMRNPFKIHLDEEDGTGETEVWLGDVGRNDRDEFTILKNGENAGWAYHEGNIVTPGLSYSPGIPAGSTPHKEPIFSYPHSNGNNSATGGILYRAGGLPELTGRYICGDFGSGRIWSISRDGSSVTELTALRQASNRVVDFHLDPVTEDIFVLENDTWSGGAEPKLLRITIQGGGEEDYPARLSDLGIFADLADLSPNPGVLPYQPNLTFWSDGADKSRWFAIKNTSDMIGYSQDGNWSFPEGMIWVKHFDFDLDRTQPGTLTKRLETRVMVRNEAGTYGVSYRWNEAGTEATLSPNAGEDFTIDYTDEGGAPASLGWRIPARAECLTCHTEKGGHALSMNTRQFNLDTLISGQSGNLISLLSDGGYLSGFTGDPGELPRIYRPDEAAVDLEDRVRSYLAVNCAYCHQEGGSAPPSWDGRAHLTLAETGLLYGVPMSEGTPDPSDHMVRPGDKDNSSIWNKINARSAVNGTFNGYTQMPPLASNALDDEGIALIGEWIDHHANLAPQPAPGSLGQTEVSENELAGYILGAADATDPDVRDGVADQERIRYEIIAGNDAGLFTIDPLTGELGLNGWIDYERQNRHVLTIEVNDQFAPNPGVLTHMVEIDLIDETSPDLTEDADNNGIFDHWESSFGVVDPAADGDRDGIADFFEFLTGGDPGEPDPPSLLGLWNEPEISGEGTRVGWNVRNGFVLGQDYRIQHSENLDGWRSLVAGTDYEIVSVTPVAEGISRVVLRVTGDRPHGFFRLGGPGLDGP